MCRPVAPPSCRLLVVDFTGRSAALELARGMLPEVDHESNHKSLEDAGDVAGRGAHALLRDGADGRGPSHVGRTAGTFGRSRGPAGAGTTPVERDPRLPTARLKRRSKPGSDRHLLASVRKRAERQGEVLRRRVLRKAPIHLGGAANLLHVGVQPTRLDRRRADSRLVSN